MVTTTQHNTYAYALFAGPYTMLNLVYSRISAVGFKL